MKQAFVRVAIEAESTSDRYRAKTDAPPREKADAFVLGRKGIIEFGVELAASGELLLNHLVRPWDGFASLVHYD